MNRDKVALVSCTSPYDKTVEDVEDRVGSAVYHIISRGNRGEHIFAEDQGKILHRNTSKSSRKYKEP